MRTIPLVNTPLACLVLALLPLLGCTRDGMLEPTPVPEKAPESPPLPTVAAAPTPAPAPAPTPPAPDPHAGHGGHGEHGGHGGPAAAQPAPTEPAGHGGHGGHAPGGKKMGAHMDHSGHHGGQVGMAGDLHIEVVTLAEGRHRVYLSDAYRKPIKPTGTRGRFIVTRAAGLLENLPLKEVGDYLEAAGRPILPTDGQATARVALNHGKERVKVDFLLRPPRQ